MEDPSDRLRRDQERQNRRRENDRYDRRHSIESLRSRSRIGDLSERIKDQERKTQSDEALDAMSAGWAEARTAIEQCTSVTSDVQERWLKRFDAIRYSGKSSVCSALDDLENDINAVVASVSKIATDLRTVIESRRSSRIARALPEPTSFPRSTVVPKFILDSQATRLRPARHRGVLPSHEWPDVLGTHRRADDLQGIHDRIVKIFSVPLERRMAWINRMDEIDRRGNRGLDSSGEGLEALAGDIAAFATVLGSVGIALAYQASKCRMFWSG